MIKFTNTMRSYLNEKETHDYEVEVADEFIRFALTNDVVDNQPATYPRSIQIELRDDNKLQILVYGRDQDDPEVFQLKPDGTIECVS